ncbi:MAG: DUF3656 domain-containing protein [Oscillospiraceae bacterium]|jgi:putative protease|nr:DUF3656 domain-containing protein [Oscillospiraceae bacterium]
MELLSPAASTEGLRAAVLNGADAVYLGLGAHNARRGAKNFTIDEFAKAAEFCRVRNVRVYVTLNTLVTDRELSGALDIAVECARLGADAFIVADLGLVRALRRVLPDTPLHASTQMSIHSLDGVKLAAAMGLSRVVLARELPKSEIAYITQNSPIETEVFVHGALCMSYSGQCYFSSVLGRRSGNRGMCAQPCREPYGGTNTEKYPLSLRDNALYKHLREIEDMGVSCVKIEGRMKRAEYAAIVTRVYSKLIREKTAISTTDERALRAAFSRDGFTDGYFEGKVGARMFGVHDNTEQADAELFREARRTYAIGSEIQRVPVRFYAEVRSGKPARLAAEDDRGNRAVATVPPAEPAFHRDLTAASLSTQLYKTGGTPFYAEFAKCAVDEGQFLPAASVNELRRGVLAELKDKRRAFTPPREGELKPEPFTVGRTDPPVFTVSVQSADQISREMLDLHPAMVYLPAEELGRVALVRPLIDEEGIEVGITLPRVMLSTDMARYETILNAAAKAGITDVLCGNIGQIPFVRALGLNARGDFGLNIFSSQSARTAREIGLTSMTLSFEMSVPQIRDCSKEIDAEVLVYGRLPLMLTENCVIKSASGVCSCGNFRGIENRNGAVFPVVRESGTCRTVVLNSQKLFLADRLADFRNIGLWGLRLYFTTENAHECADVMRRYMSDGTYSPTGFTRGLYYKGVE